MKTTPTMKLQILVDNHAEAGLASEHGLSLWIETGERRMLFDTGQGQLFQKNAGKLGVDTGVADLLILSHGHYDHTGGVADFLQHSRDSHIFCHPGVVVPRYAIRNGLSNPIHMPHVSIAAMNKISSQRLHWVQEPLFLSDNIGLTGHIPRETTFESTGGPFFLDQGGTRADPIADDMALWIRTEKGVVVIVGCCHAGLVNTLNYIQQLNNPMRIRAVIGGFHLTGAKPQRLIQTVNALKSLKFDQLIPCHCTGQAAVDLLCSTFGDRVTPGAAGRQFQF
jgi:7,8-dihydropterin-6-yl-methyl-4-(beta-D-ribofuranosyl)aminobenzene 5'-phosphate synthase